MDEFRSRDQHSLEQLAMLERMRTQTPLSPIDGLFLTTQLVIQGLPGAERAIDLTADALPNRGVQAHLAGMRTIHHFLRDLPHRDRVMNNGALWKRLYRKDGYLLTKGKAHPEKLLVVFGTMYNNFSISNALLMALLLEFDVSIMMIKDCTLLNFLGGVDGLGDTIEEVAASIGRIAGEIGARELYFTGFSSGSYGALYSALLTDAAGYLGFSAITDLAEGSPCAPPKFFTQPVRDRIDRRFLRNLRDMVEAKGTDFSGRIYCGDRSVVDQDHARNMVGLNSVDVVWLQDCGHSTPLRLIADGRFRSAFAALLNL